MVVSSPERGKRPALHEAVVPYHVLAPALVRCSFYSFENGQGSDLLVAYLTEPHTPHNTVHIFMICYVHALRQVPKILIFPLRVTQNCGCHRHDFCHV